MKLYYAPGACSLANHIALREAGLPHELVKVDLRAHRTEDGRDYYAVNPKGYVPALELDDGDGTITENVAILDYIAAKAPALVPQVRLARTRLLEMLAFISTELHKNFGPFFRGGSDELKQAAAAQLGKRFDWLADQLQGDYLFGDSFSAADGYLFVMLLWSDKFGVTAPDTLIAYRQRVAGRKAVGEALAAEGLA